MPITILYTTSSTNTVDTDPVGKIVLFDKYQVVSAFFPYFYMGEKNQILKYSNWPELVPYLYDKKINIYNPTTNINTNTFAISAFSLNNKILSLKFTDQNIIKMISMLDEDRKTYYLENNNSYANWNRTITPLSNLVLNNKIYLTKDANYYISNITISAGFAIIYISVPQFTESIIETSSTISFEFGLYRIPNNNRFQSVYYSQLKGKYFSLSNYTSLIGGLRTRSAMMGHLHEHIHDMQNHTHNMSHTHDLSNHTHAMSHLHGFRDFKNGDLINVNILNGTGLSVNLVSNNFEQYLTTDFNVNTATGTPSTNLTESFSDLSVIADPNETSNIQVKTTDLNTQYISNEEYFKVGNKNYAETYTVFPYMYGKKYIP